jgi:hypothetical protein
MGLAEQILLIELFLIIALIALHLIVFSREGKKENLKKKGIREKIKKVIDKFSCCS